MTRGTKAPRRHLPRQLVQTRPPAACSPRAFGVPKPADALAMLSRPAAVAAAAAVLALSLAAAHVSASGASTTACPSPAGPDQMVVVIPAAAGSNDPPYYSWEQCTWWPAPCPASRAGTSAALPGVSLSSGVPQSA